MGLYNQLKVFYPLPTAYPGTQDLEFQTKDLEPNFCDNYKITKGGYLYQEKYDIEDRSDPKAKGWRRIIGSMTRVNQRWVKKCYTGEVVFYTTLGEINNFGWIEFSAYFEKGKLKIVNLVELRKPKKAKS